MTLEKCLFSVSSPKSPRLLFKGIPDCNMIDKCSANRIRSFVFGFLLQLEILSPVKRFLRYSLKPCVPMIPAEDSSPLFDVTDEKDIGLTSSGTRPCF